MNCKPGMEAIAAKVLSWSGRIVDGHCWIWEGSKSTKGYGRMWWMGKLHAAHRMAYEAWHGPIPEGLHVLHSCDNPSCVNPEHLWVGTNQQNVEDKCFKNRIPRGEARANSKLTEQAVREIRSSSEGKKALAKRYGVCPTVILEVKRGIRWPHVRDPGDDATDEMVQLLGKPSGVTA